MEAGAFEGRRDAGGARKIRRLAPAHRCNQRCEASFGPITKSEIAVPERPRSTASRRVRAAWIDQSHQRLGDAGMIRKPVHDLARGRLQVVAGQEKLGECQPGPSPGPTVDACRQLRNRTGGPVHALTFSPRRCGGARRRWALPPPRGHAWWPHACRAPARRARPSSRPPAPREGRRSRPSRSA